MPPNDATYPPAGIVYTLDRSAFTITTLDEPDDSAAFWRAKTPLERLTALEYLRRMAYGPAATARLQRVLEVAQLGGD